MSSDHFTDFALYKAPSFDSYGKWVAAFSVGAIIGIIVGTIVLAAAFATIFVIVWLHSRFSVKKTQKKVQPRDRHTLHVYQQCGVSTNGD